MQRALKPHTKFCSYNMLQSIHPSSFAGLISHLISHPLLEKKDHASTCSQFWANPHILYTCKQICVDHFPRISRTGFSTSKNLMFCKGQWTWRTMEIHRGESQGCSFHGQVGLMGPFFQGFIDG